MLHKLYDMSFAFCYKSINTRFGNKAPVSFLYHSMILLPLAFYLGVSFAQPVLTPLSDGKNYAYYDTYDAYASQELDVIGSEGFKAIKK